MLLLLPLTLLHILILNTIFFYINEYGMYIIILKLPTPLIIFVNPLLMNSEFDSTGMADGLGGFYILLFSIPDLWTFIFNLYDYLLRINSYIWTCWTPNYFQNKLSSCSLFGSPWPLLYLLLQSSWSPLLSTFQSSWDICSSSSALLTLF